MSRTEYHRLARRALIVVLDGLSLWFLAVILWGYTITDQLPWASAAAFLASIVTYSSRWITGPFDSVPMILGSLAIIIVTGGLLLDWLLIPLAMRFDLADKLADVPQDDPIHRRVLKLIFRRLR